MRQLTPCILTTSPRSNVCKTASVVVFQSIQCQSIRTRHSVFGLFHNGRQAGADSVNLGFSERIPPGSALLPSETLPQIPSTGCHKALQPLSCITSRGLQQTRWITKKTSA